eukprot:805029_1
MAALQVVAFLLFYLDTMHATCCVNPVVFSCPVSGYLPYYQSCRSCNEFIQCGPGSTYVKQCATGTKWDQSRTVCLVASTTCPCPATAAPTEFPTRRPTMKPTPQPSARPTSQPSSPPTESPISTFNPTLNPTLQPSLTPTSHPTFNPTFTPTSHPSVRPTSQPSSPPTQSPISSFNPTLNPTLQPTLTPTSHPTFNPAFTPTSHPSLHPDVVEIVHVLLNISLDDALNSTEIENQLMPVIQKTIANVSSELDNACDSNNDYTINTQQNNKTIITIHLFECDIEPDQVLVAQYFNHLKPDLIENIHKEVDLVVHEDTIRLYVDVIKKANEREVEEDITTTTNESEEKEYEVNQPMNHIWDNTFVITALAVLMLCLCAGLCLFIHGLMRKTQKAKYGIEMMEIGVRNVQAANVPLDEVIQAPDRAETLAYNDVHVEGAVNTEALDIEANESELEMDDEIQITQGNDDEMDEEIQITQGNDGEMDEIQITQGNDGEMDEIQITQGNGEIQITQGNDDEMVQPMSINDDEFVVVGDDEY